MTISANADAGSFLTNTKESLEGTDGNEDISTNLLVEDTVENETEDLNEYETIKVDETSDEAICETKIDEYLETNQEQDILNTIEELFELNENIQEKENSDISNKLTLLLNETADLEEVKSVLYGMNPSFLLVCIEEINLVNIESEEGIDEKEIMSNSIIRSATSDYGKLVEVEQEGIILTDVCPDSTQMSLDTIEEEIDTDNDNIELLHSLAWNIDDVTETKESLEVSTGNGIEIALIDSGVDYLHPLLVGKINLNDAKSYISEDTTLNDTNGHGTMVSGIIAQIASDAKITPYRVIGEATGDSLWTIEAIVQATNDGKDVINMSLGTYKNVGDVSENLTVKAFERAVNYAVSNGVILVSSAGNNGLNLDINYQENLIRHLPGSLEGVIAVSSTTRNQEFASYSNYGSNIQFAAPGGDIILVDGMYDLGQWIYTTYPSSMDNGLGVLGIPQGYMFSVGTSLSAPEMTAGIASFMTYYKEMTGEAASRDIVLNYFENGVVDLGTTGYDTYFGNGKIDIFKTLSMIEDKVPPYGEMISTVLEINTNIGADELVINILDNKDNQEDIKVYFEIIYEFNTLGEKEIVIVLEDASGNKAYLSGIITVVDTIAPTGKARKAVIYQGDKLDPEQLVYDIQDNAGDDQVKIQLITDIDSSELGLYPVIVSLKDQSGNETLIESEVEIKVLPTQAEEENKVETKESLPQEKETYKKSPLALSSTVDNSFKEVRYVKSTAPDTGDKSEVYLLIGVMFICVSMVCIVYRKRNQG